MAKNKKAVVVADPAQAGEGGAPGSTAGAGEASGEGSQGESAGSDLVDTGPVGAGPSDTAGNAAGAGEGEADDGDVTGDTDTAGDAGAAGSSSALADAPDAIVSTDAPGSLASSAALDVTGAVILSNTNIGSVADVLGIPPNAEPGDDDVDLDDVDHLDDLVHQGVDDAGAPLFDTTAEQIQPATAPAIAWPLKVTLRNHSRHTLTEPASGTFLQPGGSVPIELHDEGHASRVFSNLATLAETHNLAESDLQVDGLPTFDQKD